MATKTYKGNKTDFSHFINMALQDRMPWKTLGVLLNYFAPTLDETREIISILLNELETLYFESQKNKEALKKYQEESETLVDSERLIDDAREVVENPEESFDPEMLFDTQSSEESEETMNGPVEIEYHEDESQDTNDTHHDKMQGIDNEWYTFISNEKQLDTKTIESLPKLQEEIKSSNMTELETYENYKHNAAKTNAEKSFKEMNDEWNTFDAKDKKSESELEGEDSFVRQAKERKFQCKFCQRYFTRAGHLESHVRVHTGEVPFECNNCNKRFKRKGDLKVHERIHTGEVPF